MKREGEACLRPGGIDPQARKQEKEPFAFNAGEEPRKVRGEGEKDMNAARGPENMEQYILEHFDEALEKDYIRVYLQPVLRTLTRQYCGMEALARWEDPELGMLMPGQFIGVLEKHRRIHELDLRVLQKVCENYKTVSRRISVPVSVNLSRLDYELCDIFSAVEEAVRANKVPRSHLCIEVTESALSSNEEEMRKHIERFRQAGYGVWMDDFGSGYSSLNVLKDYMFDELKIDMRFLSDNSARARKILASVVNMAKEIGIQTLAEGVETEEEFAFLHNIGCEKVQGFLFGKPMPMDECLEHAARMGIAWEAPGLRWYYDGIGRTNVLSARPMQGGAPEEGRITGRELNSIAIAMVELRKDRIGLLFTNEAFDQVAPAVMWPFPREGENRFPEVSMEEVSWHLQKLLEEARQKGKSKLMSVYDNDYYAMSARLLESHGQKHAILMSVTNLSRAISVSAQRRLDEGLRSLYTVYEQVCLINLKEQSIASLYLDRDNGEKKIAGELRERTEAYCQVRLYPDDRERYREFLDPDTMEERAGRQGGISIHLRCLDYHGSYVWKCYQLVKIRQDVYYLLIRGAEKEVRELQARYMRTGSEDGSLSPALLWENAVRHAELKFFWKDTERRFLGVSQSFLDYYHFRDQKEVLGKTDEDMGWHIHNDPYRDEELKVLQEGIVSRKVRGNCLARGEDHQIVATKIPLYDRNGKIVGLMGSFYQADAQMTAKDALVQARTDELTGLLNSRGLYEDLFTYVDEFELRGRDFAFLEVSIDEMEDINTRFGYDFGDALIRETGRKLLARCGHSATVGRASGSNFRVMRQFEDPREAEELVEAIRGLSAEPFRINGATFNAYISVGMALYSETRDRNAMADLAEIRRVTDDLEHISADRLMDRTRRSFHAFDDLPLAYAAFRMMKEEAEKDAIVIYVNRQFARFAGTTPEQLAGKRLSSFFAPDDRRWLATAERAGVEGKSFSEILHDRYTGGDIEITAYPVIGAGFFAATFREV